MKEANNTEVIWNDEKTHPINMIVNGKKLTMEEYHEKYPLEFKGEFKEIETMPCNACEGSGDDEEDYGCPYCNGSGRVEIENE